MEAVVDKSFGDVVDGYLGFMGDVTNINDALVGDEAVFSGVQDGVCICQAFGDVVGTENGYLGGPA